MSDTPYTLVHRMPRKRFLDLVRTILYTAGDEFKLTLPVRVQMMHKLKYAKEVASGGWVVFGVFCPLGLVDPDLQEYYTESLLEGFVDAYDTVMMHEMGLERSRQAVIKLEG